MKIAFVSNYVEPTGGDNILYNHAYGLTKLGHKVDSYFSGFLNTSKEHDEDWNSGNIETIIYGDNLARYNWKQYDIVVANGVIGANLVMGLDVENKAWFCQNFDPYVFPKDDRNSIDSIYNSFDKYLLYCHDLGKVIKHYYGDKKFIYCNNGVNYKSFEPYQKGIGKTDRVCFMVAYYRDYKGIKLANDIFSSLKDKGYTTVEINATTGPLKNTMEFHKNPSFEDKCKIIASCCIMIHPSVFETWGLVPMESMALGVPVVGVNSRGIMEYATENNSIIVDHRDAYKIVEEIDMLINDDDMYNKLVKNGIQTAKEHDWETIMPSIEKSYRDLLDVHNFELHKISNDIKPKTTLIIGDGRCGTTLLGLSLHQHDELNFLNEPLNCNCIKNMPEKYPSEVHENVIKNFGSVDNMFGNYLNLDYGYAINQNGLIPYFDDICKISNLFKVHYSHCPSNYYEFWKYITSLDNVQFIHLKRKNKFEMFVSRMAANATHIWHVDSNSTEVIKDKSLSVDIQKFTELFTHIDMNESFFDGKYLPLPSRIKPRIHSVVCQTRMYLSLIKLDIIQVLLGISR